MATDTSRMVFLKQAALTDSILLLIHMFGGFPEELSKLKAEEALPALRKQDVVMVTGKADEQQYGVSLEVQDSVAIWVPWDCVACMVKVTSAETKRALIGFKASTGTVN